MGLPLVYPSGLSSGGNHNTAVVDFGLLARLREKWRHSRANGQQRGLGCEDRNRSREVSWQAWIREQGVEARQFGEVTIMSVVGTCWGVAIQDCCSFFIHWVLDWLNTQTLEPNSLGSHSSSATLTLGKWLSLLVTLFLHLQSHPLPGFVVWITGVNQTSTYFIYLSIYLFNLFI